MRLPPLPTDLEALFRGDSRNIHLVIADGTIPVNITECTIAFCMKKDKKQIVKDILVEITTHTDAVNGITDILIPTEKTKLLEPGFYFYDIQLTTSTLQNKTLQFGTILIMEDVND